MKNKKITLVETCLFIVLILLILIFIYPEIQTNKKNVNSLEKQSIDVYNSDLSLGTKLNNDTTPTTEDETNKLNISKEHLTPESSQKNYVYDPALIDLTYAINLANQEEKSRALVTLAITNPNDGLLINEALASCFGNNYPHCDLYLLKTLLKNIDENNVLAKTVSMLYHLNSNDAISALDAIESIDENDKYVDYFRESTDRIFSYYQSVASNQRDKEILADIFSFTSHSIDIQTCKAQVAKAQQQLRWQKACLKYAYLKMQSTTFLDRILAMHISNDLGPAEEYSRLVLEFERLKKINQTTSSIVGSIEFIRSDDYLIWVNDIKSYGEIPAAELLLNRLSIDIDY